MKQKILEILNNDIRDLENVDFGFNYLFLDFYRELEDRIRCAGNDVVEELSESMRLFAKLNRREKNRSSYYGRKLSLYKMDLDKLI